MIFGIYQVVGHSMLPSLNPKDKILVSSIPYFLNSPQVGDIIVFVKGNKKIIKRIKKIEKDRYLVEGDNINDSKEFGWIEKKDIIGKCFYKL